MHQRSVVTKLAFYAALLLAAVVIALSLSGRCATPQRLFATIDWRFLLLLGSFMLIATGLQSSGFMEWLAGKLAYSSQGITGLYPISLGGAFLLAMLVTNDAALFAVIPLTLALARRAQLDARRLVIYEIIAVNLGSALTPWGNPQNLLIYHRYQLQPHLFFLQSGLFTACSLIGLALLVTVTSAFSRGRGRLPVPVRTPELEMRVSWSHSAALLGLFALAVVSVLRLVPAPVPAALLLLFAGLLQRESLRRLDWYLLGTFLVLFPAMAGLGQLFSRTLGERFPHSSLEVYLISMGLSQVISNVPAAMLLSHATTDWRALFYGVNLGGLGTIIASFANLIGLGLYFSNVDDDNISAFLKESLLWNVLLLLILGRTFAVLIKILVK